jgi:hypothetical protein
VQNWTLARDLCQQTNLHGTFSETGNVPTTRHLVPIFGASKLSMSNDILIPSVADFEDSFSSNASSTERRNKVWEDKTSGIVWRGIESTNACHQWFVTTMNATAVREAMDHVNTTNSNLHFALAMYSKYTETTTEYLDLPTMLELVANVGFTILHDATASSFKSVRPIDASGQVDFKYLPTFSSSSSFLTYLRSTSVPLSSSISTTWLDTRLIPWLHFIPVASDFADIYVILDYFVGNGKAVRGDEGEMVGQGAHDWAARRTALGGREWAERVVRREDAAVYLGKHASINGST